MSDETKAKISAAAKARPRKPHTEEVKERIRAAVLARPKRDPMSDETKARISEALRGQVRKPMSDGTKAKISAAAASRSRTPLSGETKARISKALKGKTRKPMSDETKEKIRAAATSRARKPLSDRTKALISAALTGKPKPDGFGFRIRKAVQQGHDAANPLVGLDRIPPPPHWRRPTDTRRTYRPFRFPTEGLSTIITATEDEWETLLAMEESFTTHLEETQRAAMRRRHRAPAPTGERAFVEDGEPFYYPAITFPISGGAVHWGYKLFRATSYQCKGQNQGYLNLGGEWVAVKQTLVRFRVPGLGLQSYGVFLGDVHPIRDGYEVFTNKKASPDAVKMFKMHKDAPHNR